MKAKLTKRAADSARPAEKDTFVWDTDATGFGLKISPTGRKSYIVQTRLNGRVRRFTIGRHGAPWTPDKARTEARRILSEVVAGKDPQLEKRRLAADVSMAQLVDRYFADACHFKKETTLAVEKGLAKRHINPLLGNRRVSTLTRTDIRKFLTDVADGKTKADIRTRPRGRAIVKGGKGTANRTTDLLQSILSFAREEGAIDENPAFGAKRFLLEPRERFLSSVELKRLGDALEAEAVRGGNPLAIAALRLLVLTGCRKSEVLSLEWDHIDWEHACLRLPTSKTGAKAVQLGAPALELLSDLQVGRSSRYVFPGTAGKPFQGLPRVWRRVRESAGLKDVRLHDLRHSFASYGVTGGDSLFVVGKLLGHSKASTTQRYAHLADDPVKAAANRIAGHIDEIMKGRSGRHMPD